MATPASVAMSIADALRLGDRRYKVSETRFLMGTYVAITAVHESKSGAEQGIAMAFTEIERLAALFDRHQANTPVSVLNETGRLTDVAPELREVMEKAQSFYQSSNGAFDSTVLPVVEMIMRNANPAGRINLTKSDLDDALALVDSEALHISEREISFSKQGMEVTLDGIGKGFIVDRASDLLAAHGIVNHLINAGGDIRARGERSEGQPWIVAIEDPAKKGNYPAIIQLKDAAVATSGGYEVYFDADQSVHHVVNPQTAVSPAQSVSVSVTAPTVMEADALSTSAFVMDHKNAVSFVDKHRGCGCLMIAQGGDKIISSNWAQMVRG